VKVAKYNAKPQLSNFLARGLKLALSLYSESLSQFSILPRKGIQKPRLYLRPMTSGVLGNAAIASLLPKRKAHALAFGRSRSFWFASDLQAIAKRLRLGASPQPHSSKGIGVKLPNTAQTTDETASSFIAILGEVIDP